MKFTKLIPLAMAAMLVSPAFAAETQQELLQITLPAFVEVTKESTADRQSTNATISEGYAGVTLTNALNAKFRVKTNYHANNLKVEAKAPVSGGTTVDAIYGSATSPKFVFTNTSQLPADTSVSNIMGNSVDPDKNPNAIGFGITRTVTKVKGPASPAYTENLNTNVLEYTFPNGEWTFDYTSLTTADTSTFSIMDEQGTYQNTVIITWLSGT